MPSATLPEHGAPQVDTLVSLFREALDHAQTIKPTATIEPPLAKSDFDTITAQLPAVFPCASPDYTSDQKDTEKARLYAVVETAARTVFSALIASTTIESPEFVQLWNLLDFLSVLSDSEQCDPALVFWLVEELLDSQTVNGCRKVWDFLESRRERMTAKNKKQKALVILRSCNDLLRRLSRAEDAAFCGRVYIFMFQSINFGDKSSVNLRGEYHVDNVTTFEQVPTEPADTTEKMDVDAAVVTPKENGKDTKPSTKAVSFDASNKSASDKPLDTDALYPVFWSLQHYFSQPTTLFDAAQLAKFKNGLEATMSAFDAVEQIQKSTKSKEDGKIIPQKRKASDGDDLRSTDSNPKYLTSRELFKLEISDVYFRRHILIQAFIILDFLLSLTPPARARIANVTRNKSVVYGDQNLEDDDAKWARIMKERITQYIQAEPDGYFFFRVVESVISRDKGWVRWKVENCPPIEKPPVSPDEFNDAKSSARRMATSRRSKPPMNALSLDFMNVEEKAAAMEKLKDATRFKLPGLEEFRGKIEDNAFDYDTAKSEKDKTEALEAKASITWRALRIARRSKLRAFDRIDEWQNIDVVFHDQPEVEENAEESGSVGRQPHDKGCIILVGSSGVGKSALVSALLDRERGVFGKIIQHTTRSPRDGEVNGQDYHFVDSKTFNQILDGDYFLEFSNRDGVDYGTNRKTAEALEESGKIPVIQLDREGAQMAKDNGFSARTVLILPPDMEELETRLRKVEGMPEDRIQAALKAAQEDLDQPPPGDVYDAVITNGDLEKTYKELEEFIYQAPQGTNGVNGGSTPQQDVSMEDLANGSSNAV
ncbi:THO complex subunit 1 transcription elongation factor-domain-containing protein [Xylariaceae sp. FL0804]|nr:THO complex subunit 1 transcription elongation factor-domain-containing protein [Xylariaceae sp. FL0804]